MIKVTLPDGNIMEVEQGSTAMDIAKAISPSLAKKVLAAKINGDIKPPFAKQDVDFALELITDEDEAWNALNTTVAASLGIFLTEKGYAKEVEKFEANEDGFFVEFSITENISENQLERIANEYKKWLSKLTQCDKSLTPLNKIKEVVLRGISGIASGGNRIFGFAAFSADQKERLDEIIKDRSERDHRKIGKELELFFFNQDAARGLPFWLPNGVVLKKQLAKFLAAQEEKFGFTRIETPLIGSIDLYKTSGHYYHYKDGMYPEMEVEKGEVVFLRPMSCPHHCTVYKYKPRSYKELPLRFSEEVLQYRYEASGALIGLERVRGMQLTDAHVFLRPDQLEAEISNAFELIKETLEALNVDIHYIELALHDPENFEKYHGDKELWEASEKALEDFLVNNKIEFKKMRGEAAFYGPKIDIQIKTALGHIITVSTLQLDYLLPEKFELKYVDENGDLQQPVMIHRGLIGTYERFISVLLEQTKGNLPMWLAPKQAVIIPVNNEAHGDYANELYAKLKEAGVRVELDNSDDRISNKIRKHQTSKVKTQLVVGDEEVSNKTIAVRRYGEEDSNTMSFEELLEVYK